MNLLRLQSTKTVFIIMSLALMLLVTMACAAPQSPIPPTYIKVGEVGYIFNPNYEPGEDLGQKYNAILVAGDLITDTARTKTDKFMVVTHGEVGIRGNRILSPGSYPRIPQSDVRKVKAADIPAQSIGIYQEAGSYKLLQPGLYDIPADKVAIFPAVSLRYRTLAESIKNDPNACETTYLKCEGSLTGASVAGTLVTATIDVDIILEFIINEKLCLGCGSCEIPTRLFRTTS